jgi:hypothetical protein
MIATPGRNPGSFPGQKINHHDRIIATIEQAANVMAAMPDAFQGIGF